MSGLQKLLFPQMAFYQRDLVQIQVMSLSRKQQMHLKCNAPMKMGKQPNYSFPILGQWHFSPQKLYTGVAASAHAIPDASIWQLPVDYVQTSEVPSRCRPEIFLEKIWVGKAHWLFIWDSGSIYSLADQFFITSKIQRIISHRYLINVTSGIFYFIFFFSPFFQ